MARGGCPVGFPLKPKKQKGRGYQLKNKRVEPGGPGPCSCKGPVRCQFDLSGLGRRRPRRPLGTSSPMPSCLTHLHATRAELGASPCCGSLTPVHAWCCSTSHKTNPNLPKKHQTRCVVHQTCGGSLLRKPKSKLRVKASEGPQKPSAFWICRGQQPPSFTIHMERQLMIRRACGAKERGRVRRVRKVDRATHGSGVGGGGGGDGRRGGGGFVHRCPFRANRCPS